MSDNEGCDVFYIVGSGVDWGSVSDHSLHMGATGIHDAYSLIESTNQNLPAQIARYERLK